MFSQFRGLAFGAVTALVITGCADQPTAVASPATVSLARGGPQASIPLIVTVPVSGTMVRSDGLGDYVSGVNGMIAELDDPGNLQFTPANASSTVAPSRTLVIDYSVQLSGSPYTPDMSNQHNFKIKTGNAGLPRIQDLAVGASACYPTTIASQSGGATSASASVHHQASFNDAFAPGSTFARVTRTSSTSWSMVSDGGCAGPANVAGVSSQTLGKKDGPLIFRGMYSVRFSITFSMKP